jgi:putative oxidoreductase
MKLRRFRTRRQERMLPAGHHMRPYPFMTLDQALIIARIMTAVFFLAHALVRIINGSIPQFGGFMESLGFPAGVTIVWLITLTELICGTLLIVGRYVRWATVPLLTIAATGIVLIHRHFGWFVGEHGTGGSEYSVALIVLLAIVAAADSRHIDGSSSTGGLPRIADGGPGRGI